MKADLKFAKVVILVGCLVILGLNTAAQGLEKMSPEISPGFLEFSSHHQVLTVTVMGREYYFDARGTIYTLDNLKNRVAQSGEHWKQRGIFWGNLILERGSTFLRLWKDRFQELLFNQERKSYIL